MSYPEIDEELSRAREAAIDMGVTAEEFLARKILEDRAALVAAQADLARLVARCTNLGDVR